MSFALAVVVGGDSKAGSWFEKAARKTLGGELFEKMRQLVESGFAVLNRLRFEGACDLFCCCVAVSDAIACECSSAPRFPLSDIRIDASNCT